MKKRGNKIKKSATRPILPALRKVTFPKQGVREGYELQPLVDVFHFNTF